MATESKLKEDIKKLETAINGKAPEKLKAKFKNQLAILKAELSALQKPVASKMSRAKQLRAKYKALYGVRFQGIDIEKDADIPAMKIGRRVSKGIKGNQYASKKQAKGNVYYEYRENRIDMKQPSKKYPKLEDGGMMAKGGEIAFKNSNLYLNGFGVDSNGNSVIKVSFPNQRAFSIQTNGKLKETNNKYTKKIKDLSDEDLKIIENEVVSYVKEFGSKEQKSKLNFYKAGGYMAKGGKTEEKLTVSNDEHKLGLNILSALSGYNSGLSLNGILENMGLSNYRFNQYASPSTVMKVKKELKSLIKQGFIEEGGIGFKITQKGADYLRSFEYGSYADGGMMANGGYMAKGGKVKVKEKVYIDFLNKKKGFSQDRINFDSYTEAKQWGMANIENFNSDMINFEFSDGGMMAKGGSVKNYLYIPKSDIKEIKASVDGVNKSFTNKDIIDGAYVKNSSNVSKVSNKSKYPDKEIQSISEKMINIYNDAWDKIDISSGTDLYSNKNKQELIGKFLSTKGLDKIYTELSPKDRDRVSDILEDENYHSLNNYLALRGYRNNGKWNDAYDYYYEQSVNQKNKSVLDPKVISRIEYFDGGMMADGGAVNEDNMEMVVSQVKAIKHHAEELSKIVTPSTPIEAWVVAKIERSETDLSDVTHYLDGLKMEHGGRVTSSQHRLNR